jgi:putative NADPH-quinone reductase
MYSLLIGNLIRKAMLRSVFKTMGYRNLKWMSYYRVKSVSQEKRVKWLADLEKRFAKLS